MDVAPLAELDWFTGDEAVDRLLDRFPRSLRRMIATRPRNAVRLSTPRLVLREVTAADYAPCARAWSGTGIAAEAGGALIDLARRLPRVRRAFVDCDARNERCIAVARKLGLRRVALSIWAQLAMHQRYAVDLPYARFVTSLEPRRQ
jgi:RimJ/RimL family protein N-acetyltransferase